MARIYTRTGDGGETSLIGGRRAPKADARVDLYGEVDELNSHLGLAVALLGDAPPPAAPRDAAAAQELRRELAAIQSRLFDLGALLADPERSETLAREGAPVPGLDEAELERAIDRLEADLAPLRRFILPGGIPAAAALHIARTVCRRVERRTVAAARDIAVPGAVVRYLNRLSDYLFVAARRLDAAHGAPETVWVPYAPGGEGGSRT